MNAAVSACRGIWGVASGQLARPLFLYWTCPIANILIVDDAVDASEALARFLKKQGHQVRCVTDGKNALLVVLSEPTDLAILDLIMPEMDGPSFLEIVRSYLRLQSLPVVVLTAVSDGPLLDRVRNAKVNSILIKSQATHDQILSAVHSAIHHIPI